MDFFAAETRGFSGFSCQEGSARVRIAGRKHKAICGDMIRARLVIAVAYLLPCGFSPLVLAAAEDDQFSLLVADRFAHDNNIFRKSAADIAGLNEDTSGISPTDYINDVSLGINGNWLFGRQALVFRAQVTDERYTRNEFLNNRSGSGKVTWNWRVTDRLTGQLGGEYNRSLASFANTQLYSKDLVDTQMYFANIQLEIGPHLKLKGGVNHNETSHSLEQRKADQYRSDSGSVGVEYATSAGNTLGWNYRYTKAKFPYNVSSVDSPADRDYRDNSGNVTFKYALSGKTVVDGSAGYLRRDYRQQVAEETPRGDFSGDVWRLALQWQPSVKTGVGLSAWRELRAYLDTESDYFISTGGSIKPTWAPSTKSNVSLEYGYEDQKYIGSGITTIESPGRRDKLHYAQAGITYTPRRVVTFALGYRYEQRDSNRSSYEYDDDLASLSVSLTF